MSRARDRWLDEGVDVLAKEGVGGVRIDRIAERLGLSKGSFHHHFAGAGGYKVALLGHLEELLTAPMREAGGHAGGEGDARGILGRLTSLLGEPDADLYRPRLEIALRAWALTDADAAETQARIDSARLAALRRVWSTVTEDEEQARLAALLPYVIGVGATVLVPPVEADDLRRLFEFILPLVPGGDGDDVTVASGGTDATAAPGGERL
ncbi:TetR/AcrR family transcriptional regulator [Agromyces laixinhei]|uniref:TetR/AcrR family transcriptional regulator n=1 Tax=Agromyces laixinhei TaxID=2585717 RepID=UPI0012ED08F3|nr:TetR/AcrR family transcriptional regulator [Agromyces laixinhei]